MKKALSIALMVICTAASAAVQTNWVYVVSNIYIRTSEVRYVTNRVQNTHYNYYYTNNVTTITNIWTVNHTTNINYEVIFDNFGPWIEAASNQANRAASSATAARRPAASRPRHQDMRLLPEAIDRLRRPTRGTRQRRLRRRSARRTRGCPT